jgi:hypothetical protein
MTNGLTIIVTCWSARCAHSPDDHRLPVARDDGRVRVDWHRARKLDIELHMHHPCRVDVRGDRQLHVSNHQHGRRAPSALPSGSPSSGRSFGPASSAASTSTCGGSSASPGRAAPPSGAGHGVPNMRSTCRPMFSRGGGGAAALQ